MSLVTRLTFCSLPLFAFPVVAQAASDACAGLASNDPQVQLLKTLNVPAGEIPKANPGRAALTGQALSKAAMPAHCLVEGLINPRQGSDGQAYGIRFELRMPQDWNGRFLFQGGGGMDGVVNQALGAIPFRGASALPALNRGYAVVATDSGHAGKDSSDARFGLDQQARLDYAYAAIGQVTRQAKQLLAEHYGRGPEHSVFMGCSNGGRAALMAAQRFPTEFDGIIAGNPGLRLSRAAVAQAWDTRALEAAAPRTAAGEPILAQSLTRDDMSLVSRKVLERCDALDGARDGSIDAMSQCRFDPADLQCTADGQGQCLSAAKVQALRTVFDGAKDSQGRSLYANWPWDAGIASDGWRAWKLGTSQTGQPNARNATLTPNSLGYYFMTPPNPNLTLAEVDFDQAAAAVAETGAINDPTGTQLSSFIANGGKLIVIHGNSDPVFSANDLRHYWHRLARDNGGQQPLGQWARLFMVPGMAHCGDGPALDNFDPLQALQDWQDHNTPPQQLIATGNAFPGRSRPLCPYPLEARYSGQGDMQNAESFTCSLPDTQQHAVR
ncbi:tannase/feruloyl esterase family alpha/beta hydrolase [Pseudomonas sp. 21LCFQ02]|uniref:tannase/feruloyl esterase family alpha/beta hydrolase n=1 Tax=Pseudomonas sp. 21LCFQ02 TaxID=2957505 RepID=UPI00209B8254|nr:tannase/feruloyl esterase family alpha/beta hydrolase [Pseudomonas sp. 21LCFQ02]MCO8170734.1 tannase/feruloyl esterase family alpha/beta hydrolase [Pseudomonas sp. 21LCFQ02]